jgi:uncharacterized SAM-binding protein YcdF (DUF218 family)
MGKRDAPPGTIARYSLALWRLARIPAFLGCLAIVGFGAYGAALLLSEVLLVKRDEPARADVIVVLGGNGPPRAARAAALWRQGKAPAIIVTGYGDCGQFRDMLISKGVPPAAITTECRSSSTWENASFSEPIIRDMGVTRAIITTSWFHSGRAVKRFRSLMPQVEWLSLPAERSISYWKLARDADGIQIVKEYAKVVLYDLRAHVFGVGSAQAATILPTWGGLAK